MRGDRLFVFDRVESIDASELREIGGDAAIARVAMFAKDVGARAVFGDQREAMMLKSAFRRCGVQFRELAWTSTSKPRAVARVRRWLLEGRLALPSHPELRRELLSFEERITASGDFTFGARGSGHDDFVALLLTAALADEDRKLVGSPLTSSAGSSDGASQAWVGRPDLVVRDVRGEGDPFGRLQPNASGGLTVMPRRGSRPTFGGSGVGGGF